MFPVRDRTFQDAMARWNAKEQELQEIKRQEILTMQKVWALLIVVAIHLTLPSQLYEARDTASRYTRLCTHLDRMHALVFSGVKIGTLH